MNILLSLLLWLNYYYTKHAIFFLQRSVGIVISLFYLFEYIFIFLLKINYIYIFFLYLFIKRENLIKKKHYYKIISLKKKRKEEKKIIMDPFLKLYYKRHMYIGLSIVYMQIFLRKIRESKNYIIFFFNYKFRYFYISLKKKNINYSLYFFFSNNYFLAIYIDNFKKKLYNFYLIFFFIIIYYIIKFREKILSFYSLKKKWRI